MNESSTPKTVSSSGMVEEATLLLTKKKPQPPRSLTSPTRTACHLASALLLLHHCLPPIRWTVLALANQGCDKKDTDLTLLHHLACLLRTLEDDDSGETIAADPSLVYQQVSATIGVEPHMLGDAVTALVKVLQYLRSVTVEVANETAMDNKNKIDLTATWNDWVDAGKVHSALEGTACSKSTAPDCDIDYSNRILRKETKVQAMQIPFSVPLRLEEDDHDGDSSTTPASCHSLPNLIRQQVLVPQVIDGYQWCRSSANDDDDDDDDDDVSSTNNVEWKTTKTLQIDALPPIWIIHLDRFQWNREHQRIQADEASIEIPLDWTPDFVNSSNHPANDDDNDVKPSSFHLVGGILHVEDAEKRINDNGNNKEEGGHYVCLVRQSNTTWYLLDDDQEAQEVSTEQALQLLGGSNKHSIPDEPTFMRGVLLVYHQDGMESKLSGLREQLEHLGNSTRVDWTRPKSLVGSRLHVKWAKDKYYAGVVSEHDSQTGKHQVTYDDGDVRWYNLRKKTIEWE